MPLGAAPFFYMMLTSVDYPSIRSAITIDLVTEALLPNAVIAQTRYHPMAERDVRSAVPKLSDLTSTSTFDDALKALHGVETLTAAHRESDEALILKAMIAARTAYRLFPRIRQIVRIQAGEESEDYAKTDWDALRQDLLDEYNGYVGDLGGGDTVAANYRFCLVKAS